MLICDILTPMDFKQLRYCAVVAELGSFTKAASVLALAQSALSRQVQTLEQELGVRLFHRTGRGAVLTESGMGLMPRIRALIDDAERLAQDAKLAQDQPKGLIRLGVLTSIGHVLLTPLLSRLHERNPGIRVRVIEGLTDHLDELLATGRVDIAVLYDNRQTASATDETLFKTDLFLVGRPVGSPLGQTIRLTELARYPLTIPAPPNKLRTLIDAVCAEQRVTLNITFEVDAISTMRDLAAEGHVSAILPLHAVISDIATGRLQAARIVDPPIQRDVRLATSRQHPLDRAGTEVLRAIRQVTADLVRSGRLPAHAEKPRAKARV